jgi:glutamate-1-semialdehyde 2,1-aminomutase
MNQVDLSSYLGFGPPPVVEALSAQAARGPGFLLPCEDGLVACEDLAERTGLPFWQFTGSASTANAEVIRMARVHTGRERILMFHGKYHGDVEDTLVRSDDGDTKAQALGLPCGVTSRGATVPFNDLAALEAALAAGDIACVLAEPMLTNCNLVFADTSFWKEANALIHAAGSLLVIDEAHTHSFAYGGLTRAWEIEPDVLTIGKGLGTGLPFAMYGMTEPLARLIEERSMPPSPANHGGVGLATGGTTYGSALVQAAARAALEQCLTQEGYARLEGLGRKLAAGLETIFERRGLPWSSPQIGGRASWQTSPESPRTAAESRPMMDMFFIHTRHVFMANRGIWEAIDTAGPACSFSHGEADVDRYLEVAEEFLSVATTPA